MNPEIAFRLCYAFLYDTPPAKTAVAPCSSEIALSAIKAGM